MFGLFCSAAAEPFFADLFIHHLAAAAVAWSVVEECDEIDDQGFFRHRGGSD